MQTAPTHRPLSFFTLPEFVAAWLRRNERKKRARLFARFSAASLSERGWLCYALETEPHTLIAERFPPEPDAEFVVEPFVCLLSRNMTEKVYALDTVWSVRFRRADGSVSEITIRRAGFRLPNDENVSSEIARVFHTEAVANQKGSE